MLSHLKRARVLVALAFALASVFAYVPANAGLVLDPRRVATDAAGNGLSGAKLYVYEQGTMTLASIYSDAGLTTPLANPVVANSAGVFAPVYAAEGEIFDLALKTSGGTTLYTEDSVPAVGADSGTWLRDFGTSRGRIAGSGGVTSFEAGPAVGDDVGGDVRLGGYEGTQADTAEIDAAATSITGSMAVTGAVTTSSALATGGLITEDGKNLQGVVHTGITAFSAVAAVEIPLPNSPSGVLSWDIEIIGLSRSAVAALNATLSFDDGSTYKTGASDYGYGYSVLLGGATWTSALDDAEAFMRILPSTNAAVNKIGVLRLRVYTVASGNDPTIVTGEWSGLIDSTVFYPAHGLFTGYYVGTPAQRATTLKIAPASGTISGSYRIVPLRGFN